MHAHVEEIPFAGDSPSLFARLRHLPGAVWLDSGKPRSLQGRFDIMTALPQAEIIADQHSTRIKTGNDERASPADPFGIARELMASQGLLGAESASIPFAGGLVGYVSYELGYRLHRMPARETSIPAMHLGWYGWGIVVNHESRKCWLVIHPACDPQILSQVRDCLGTSPRESTPFDLESPFTCKISRERYLADFDRVQRYITNGDCYQVNLTARHSTRYSGDPWYAYLQLRNASPSPFSAYLDWDGTAILSCSPERFLKVSGNRVETKPIKGTIPRGKTLQDDQDNAVQLQGSEKDRAENLMIVDLLRNDIGRNCATGSVRTPKLFALESFSNVHHLVSTITGQLAEGKTPLDLLRDSFPGGSITGAPKKRAMEIIAELEPHRRDVYCGSIGYVSASGRMDTSIAIRTMLARNGEISCWGGGGLVADSIGPQEFDEALQKIRNLMDCLESNSGFL